MKVQLLNAVTDATPGSTHSKVNNKLIKGDITFTLILTGAPTTVTITVYGATDNTSFSPIAIHDAIAEGNLFHISGKSVRDIYAVASTLSGGTTPTATLFLDYEDN